jgi:hypothetical protein
MRLARNTRGKKDKYVRTSSRKSFKKKKKKKKKSHGKAELRPECSKVDIIIIIISLYVCWRGGRGLVLF